MSKRLIGWHRSALGNQNKATMGLAGQPASASMPSGLSGMRDGHLLARTLLLSLSFPSVVSYLLYFFPPPWICGILCKPVPKAMGSPDTPKAGAGPEGGGRSTVAGRPGLSPSLGTWAPIALLLEPPCDSGFPEAVQLCLEDPLSHPNNALLPQPSWLLHWPSVTCWVPAACAPERMLLLSGSPLWQCPLALKLCQGKQFPLISQLGQQ